MDHTIALIQKSHEGDDEARAQIVEENTGLVWCIVRRFAGRGTEMEDLSAGFFEGAIRKLLSFTLDDDMGARDAFGMEPPVVACGEFEGQFFVLEVILAHIHMEAI